MRLCKRLRRSGTTQMILDEVRCTLRALSVGCRFESCWVHPAVEGAP